MCLFKRRFCCCFSLDKLFNFHGSISVTFLPPLPEKEDVYGRICIKLVNRPLYIFFVVHMLLFL